VYACLGIILWLVFFTVPMILWPRLFDVILGFATLIGMLVILIGFVAAGNYVGHWFLDRKEMRR